MGRDEQLEALRRFLDEQPTANCLVLAGEAGIGKTTLWEQGLQLACDRGCRVLSTRASQAEATLSFAALADLVLGAGPDSVTTLPGPQRRALQVATLMADPDGRAPDPLAIASGFLNLLRTAAEAEPLLVAVDDVQWLDPSSAAALQFAARRLASRDDGRIRFLLCSRPGRPSALEAAFPTGTRERVTLGPLSIGAIRLVLSERLNLLPPRRVLRLVHDVSQGNPLFALEFGRTMKDSGMPEPGAELPVPDVADDLFGDRVRGLSAPLRRVLLATALTANISWQELSRLTDPLTLDDALSSGLIAVERSRVRPSHPLLGAAVRQVTAARERRELHAALASAVDDPVLRARHLAMAAVGPDSELALTVAATAAAAFERGAVHDAEYLAAHALRLTPPDSADYPERYLALAQSHLSAGDWTRVSDLLLKGLQDLPAGLPRARARLMLAEVLPAVADSEIQLQLALAETPDDPHIRALALIRQSMLCSATTVQRMRDAERLAREALAAAESAGGELRDRALTALAWARIMRGRPIDNLLRSVPPSSPARRFYGNVDRPYGVRLAFRGEANRARALFDGIRDRARESGDIRDSISVTIQSCELELRVGDVLGARRLIDEFEEWSALDSVVTTVARLRALAAAIAGLPDETAEQAAIVLRHTGLPSSHWDSLESTRALGIAALADRDPRRAAENLRSVWEHACREEADDPGAFPVAGDLVEALVLSGDGDDARGIADRLHILAERQRHPWGRATSRRCSALLRLADGYADGAAADLSDAAAAYGRLGLRFEQGRALLVLGQIQRRFNKKAAARRSLADAQELFDALGCTGWSAQATMEQDRVSGRRPSEDALTTSERRVAELAADGLSNKEIAGQLYVSVYTVEAHLSHAYAKLRVRSRGQLAGHLASFQ